MKYRTLLIAVGLLLALAFDAQSQALPHATDYALLYDGNDDYVVVTDHPSLDITAAITIEAWIKKTRNVQWAGILTKGTGKGSDLLAPNNYTLHHDSLGGLIFTGIQDIIIQSRMTTPLNEWHHVAMTWDGSFVRFYFDGVLDNAAVTALTGTLVPNDSSLVIGADFPGGDEYHAGTLDEVRLWRIARTQAEIQAGLNTPLIGNETGLVGYWRLDEGAGLLARDLTLNGNHGTLTNFNFDNTSGWVLREINSSRAVRAVDAITSVGGTVNIPLELTAQGNENALSFSLTFDTSVVALSGTPPARLGSDANGASLILNDTQIAQGRYGIALALPSGRIFTAGVRETAIVTFMVKPSTAATSTSIGFGDQPVLREVADVNANILPATWQAGTITILHGFEADVAPRSSGDGRVTVSDCALVGRFAANLDSARTDINEFQRADCASKPCGDGRVSVADWVQACRYAAALDPLVTACGPLTPSLNQQSPLVKSSATPTRTVRVVCVNPRLDTVLVQLEAQGDENALSFSLDFDPIILTFDSVWVGKDAGGAVFISNITQKDSGRVGVVLALSPGQKFAVGTREIAVAVFAINLAADTIIVGFGDKPVIREIVDPNANLLSAEWQLEIKTAVTETESANQLSFVLAQNHPNPFNPSTTISFDLPRASEVTLKVFDLVGHEVATLANQKMQAGRYSFKWDASGMPGGVYFYRLQTEAFTQTRKLLLLR